MGVGLKCIMVMFDSLNRRMLPPYGCDSTIAPNFSRLANRTVTFERSFIGSMPCMPTRRDFHTGRLSFLHRSWGPLEPFDDSVPQMLREHGVYSHLVSDHYHYWEDGGSTYHTKYSSWEASRGQEGDPYYGLVDRADLGRYRGRNALEEPWYSNDRANRTLIDREEMQPQSVTFSAGIDFLHRNAQADNWFLQIETFDPHEPFYTQRRYQDLYDHHFNEWRSRGEPIWDWPYYDEVRESAAEVAHLQYQYKALVSMCDTNLGEVLDAMDRLDMWKDTMLIVWTDHGFLLGEHNWWGKCRMPWYNELANTPLFVWDPRAQKSGERRSALVQPSIDLGPTILEFFGINPTESMTGVSLRGPVSDDGNTRDALMFGQHGQHVNVTDGRYVYMRAPIRPDNQPLFEYTLMPTHMNRPFSVDELLGTISLAEGSPFSKGITTLKIQTPGGVPGGDALVKMGNRLYDTVQDPNQLNCVDDRRLEKRMISLLINEMEKSFAPAEQFDRLGLKV